MLHAKAFWLLEPYVKMLYKLTITENGVWAQMIVSELQNFTRPVVSAGTRSWSINQAIVVEPKKARHKRLAVH